jgi:hypothetical protein
MSFGSCFPNALTITFGSLLLLLTACSSASTNGSSAAPSPTPSAAVPRIVKLYPQETPPGKPFNKQPNGQSAIAISCERATPKTVVVWDGQPLQTTFGSPEAVTAIVPQAPYAQPGEHHVHLESEAGKSDEVSFFVRTP